MNRASKRIVSLFLVFALMVSNAAYMSANEGASTEDDTLIVQEQHTFEEDMGGFISGTAEASIAAQEGNHVLKIAGAGSGNRSASKPFAAVTNAQELRYTFDWLPEDVSTAANSSEILWQDANNKPVFRIVKKGGAQGGIYYGVGSTGVDLSQLAEGLASHDPAVWLKVEVYYDFAEEQVSLKVWDKATDQELINSGPISLMSVDYTNMLSGIQLIGNRASGQTLGFTMYVDNYIAEASEAAAPEQQPRSIAAVTTPYEAVYSVPPHQSLADIISILPQRVDIQLSNLATRSNIPVNWSSSDYDTAEAGEYEFIGELDLTGVSGVINSDDIKLSVTIKVIAVDNAPEPPAGYEAVLYTDFGDSADLVPAYWGFTTANATLALHTEELAGNSSSKLHFNITDQSGGRVATKDFAQAYMGQSLRLEFDWYPGKVNDKGSNPSENGGELRIMNGSNQTILTLNHTNQSPISYYIGNGIQRGATTITEPEAWYRTTIDIDYIKNEIVLNMVNESLEVNETYRISMDELEIDTKVGGIRLGGMRTSGNNLTWDTYLDNVALYLLPLSDHTITFVDVLPYHRIYVGDATDDVATIGLPSTVPVTLSDGSTAEAAVASWEEVTPWDASKSGVYTFRGVLDEEGEYDNPLDKTALQYVYHRLPAPEMARNTEWLDRGVIALQSEDGIFVSWRLLADEYEAGVTFNLYRDGVKLNAAPLSVTNFVDEAGEAGDRYEVERIRSGNYKKDGDTIALDQSYVAIPMQKPEGGTTATGEYTYSVNDASVGDLDGDGEYEIIVKWYPSNAIDSSQTGMTGPTIFDAYKLDGTLLWRMNMGLNLTSGAHYHQFIVADLDGDGRSEMLIKTADATTVYGTTDGIYDSSKVISVIGNAEDNGRWVNDSGKVFDGPEYITVFEGQTGKVIDTIDYEFALGDVTSWGDSFHNRSDRYLAGLAYLDGKKPSVVYGRGYYERTTFVAYSLVDGQIVTEWTFDSAVEGRGGGLGYHSLATGDVDNDGYDEIIAGSLVLDEDGKILYMMDGNMGRERGSHGDAMHVGAFDPDREGLHFIGVHEDPAVASLEYHDGATGETIMSFYGSVDAGRGLAANITSKPGYEFWGTAPDRVEQGGGIYNVKNEVIADSHRAARLSINFALYWDGDLLHELLDNTSITKFNEATLQAELLEEFEGVVSNNGTKATPTLQADILGDWREEVLLPAEDSSELRVYSTTIPTDYRLYTLMHDTVYRMGIAWQNVAYNQPPHLGYYLGEDIRDTVLNGALKVPNINYTNEPSTSNPNPTNPNPSIPVVPAPQPGDSGSDQTAYRIDGVRDASSNTIQAEITKEQWENVLKQFSSKQRITISILPQADSYALTLPVTKLHEGSKEIVIQTGAGTITVPVSAWEALGIAADDKITLHVTQQKQGDTRKVELSFSVNAAAVSWSNANIPVQVTIPYELPQSSDYELITVTHEAENGARSLISNGKYDAKQKAIVFLAAHSGVFVIEQQLKSFADITDLAWAKREIEVLATKGIIRGVTDAEFNPNASITRADFTVLLVRTLGLQAEVKATFTDVAEGAYYYNAIAIAQQLGLVQGDGHAFEPHATITRQDMMVIIARALHVLHKLEAKDEIDLLDAFEDTDHIADYAKDYIAQLTAAKLVKGSYGMLNPLAELTRAEAAVLLYRIYNLD
ncbi:rhamnogalacturonan lyase family protein [Paenibacillus sp. FSL W7-1287]|uniref:rhamnogalacturonan lyase family protein n=1 Tax=Paenibacillus sp. FSL W7-1287 TaxID=2954538 RepID=UPI0030FD0F72